MAATANRIRKTPNLWSLPILRNETTPTRASCHTLGSPGQVGLFPSRRSFVLTHPDPLTSCLLTHWHELSLGVPSRAGIAA